MSLGYSQSIGDLQNFVKIPATDQFHDSMDEDEDPFSLDPTICSQDPDPYDRIDMEEMTSDQMEQSWLKLWSTLSDNDPPELCVSADPLPGSVVNSTADSIQSNVTERLDSEQERSDSVSSDNTESSEGLELESPPKATTFFSTRQCSSSVGSGHVPEADLLASTEQDLPLILPNVVKENVKMSVDKASFVGNVELNVESSKRCRLSDW